MNMMKLFRFDVMALGFNAVIPVFCLCVTMIYAVLTHHNEAYYLPAMEYIIPAAGVWWTICIFYNILEEEGSETLFTYPVSRFYYGAYRATVFYILYIIIVFISFHFIVQYADYKQLLAYFIQIAVQTFFMCGLGLLSMVLVRQIGWALFVIMGYCFTQILSRGSLVPLLNIYYFRGELPDDYSWDRKLLLTLIAGITWWAVAQAILQKSQRYA
ncbi:hypothetical protein ACH6EH_08020 [Paenibacillus sp. JSM ZJ436]|uniref:hypothetical protein n=1 Tax=Paenibacillus sp. JSM ZJ436 TaxID=3376190 RepID=UPI0037BAA8E7